MIIDAYQHIGHLSNSKIVHLTIAPWPNPCYIINQVYIHELHFLATPVTIKHAILGLLAQRPMHGYELKNAFEDTVGTLWELNIGQIYNTLRLLERDEYVALMGEEQEGRGPPRKIYGITPLGREELGRWLAEPLHQPRRLKDAFYIKLVFHKLLGLGDIQALIWRQRQAYLQILRQINDMRADVDPAEDPLTTVLIEGGAFHLEADLRWLDRCEELLVLQE
jgi:DNA-binding PadR family transcriptional regulator